MKRKILTMALGLTMAFALMVNASAAAPSVTGPTAPPVTGAVSDSGVAIPAGDLTVTSVQNATQLPAAARAELQTAYQQIVSAPSTSSFLQSAGLTTAVNQALANTSVKANDLAPTSVFDVSATGTAAQVLAQNGSVTLTFAIPAVKANTAVVVLHYTGSGWEVVPSTVSNGAVSATFTSLSPVVVLTQSTTTPGTGTVTSPQTSDVNLEGVMICGAVLGLAIIALCVKHGKAV